MKSLGLGILHLAVLTALFGCGKENESGKKNQWYWGNQYGTGGYTNAVNINSPYRDRSGRTVNEVLAQNPCRGGLGNVGFPGFPSGGLPQNYANMRIPIQIPLTSFPSVIAPGDIYVGVTSYGDVAAVVGQAINQPPLFVGYLCPRSFAPSGQGQLMGVKIGAYTQCIFKPIVASTIVFPGGGTADFRWLDGGTSMGTRFNFCR